MVLKNGRYVVSGWMVSWTASIRGFFFSLFVGKSLTESIDLFIAPGVGKKRDSHNR